MRLIYGCVLYTRNYGSQYYEKEGLGQHIALEGVYGGGGGGGGARHDLHCKEGKVGMH